MLTPSQTLAVSNADAIARSAGIPTYSDVLHSAQVLLGVALWYACHMGSADARELESQREKLAVFANENGREE